MEVSFTGKNHSLVPHIVWIGHARTKRDFSIKTEPKQAAVEQCMQILAKDDAIARVAGVVVSVTVQVGGIQELRDIAVRDGALHTVTVDDALAKLPLIGAGFALHPLLIELFLLM